MRFHRDGKTFTNFGEAQGLSTNAIQCTYQDRSGRLWLGGWQGLFRYDGDTIIRVGKDGPWEVTNRSDLPLPSKESHRPELTPAPAGAARI